MGAKLIRNGHLNIRDYRMDFFNTALEELYDSISDTIRYNSLAHRMSKLDGHEFEKMMKEETSDTGTAPLEVDHEAQIRQAQQG